MANLKRIMTYNPNPPGFIIPNWESQSINNRVPEDIDWDDIEARQHYAETRFKNNQTSHAGAVGAYQIMPIAYKEYVQKTGLTGDLHDYNFNKQVRDYMLNALYNRSFATKNNQSDKMRLAKAMAAYNWGAGNLTRHLEKLKNSGMDIYNSFSWIDTLPSETRNYVNFIVLKKDGQKDLTNDAFNKALPNRFNYKSGGVLYAKSGIHIKPENRGKFTALKRRTGKSATWFKQHGTPSQKKMATFALNAKHWSHKKK